MNALCTASSQIGCLFFPSLKSMYLFTYCSDILVCSSKIYLDSSHLTYQRLIELHVHLSAAAINSENLNLEKKKNLTFFCAFFGSFIPGSER